MQTDQRLLQLDLPDHGFQVTLIDLLRLLCRFSWDAVVDRTWWLSDLEVNGYRWQCVGESALREFFPEEELGAELSICLNGRRLMEGAALMHEVEYVHLCRVVDPDAPVIRSKSYFLHGGPSNLQASNADLEVRITETVCLEVVSCDGALLDFLKEHLAVA